MITVLHYVAADGADPFDAWLSKQRPEVRGRVQARIDRAELGTLGDHKAVGEGVFELRIHVGPGHRVYLGRDGDALVILLGGGTKKRQSRDIATAQAQWKAYKQEKEDARKGP